MLEETVQKDVEAEKIEVKIVTQGKDDSFFAGEEYKEFSTLNPNLEMDFVKFRFMPAPDFVNEYHRQTSAAGLMPNESDRIRHYGDGDSSKTDNLS